jgi:hypothetical protein
MYLLYYCNIKIDARYAGIYFKAWFSIKPRTNFGSLFNSLDETSKDELRVIHEKLKILPLSIKSVMLLKKLEFFIKLLGEIMENKKLYYIKNYEGHREGFYDLSDNLSENQFFIEILRLNSISVEEVPYCCYLIKPTLGGNPLEVLEWNSKEINGKIDTVSIEFRMFFELLRISIRNEKIDKDGDDFKKLSYLLDKDKLEIDDLESSIDLISRNFFKFLYFDGEHNLLKLRKKIDTDIDDELYSQNIKMYNTQFEESNKIKKIDDYFSDIKTEEEELTKFIKSQPSQPSSADSDFLYQSDPSDPSDPSYPPNSPAFDYLNQLNPSYQSDPSYPPNSPAFDYLNQLNPSYQSYPSYTYPSYPSYPPYSPAFPMSFNDELKPLGQSTDPLENLSQFKSKSKSKTKTKTKA